MESPVRGHEEVKTRAKVVPPRGSTRIPQALDRRVGLFTTLEKPDEVARWKAERAKDPAAKPERAK